MAYKTANSERAARWCKEHPERHRENQYKRRRDNPERYKQIAKKHYLKKEYGLTLEEHRDLFINAENRCEVCGKEDTLLVDHDHSTGLVRGVLCRSCNWAVGLACDDPSLLYAMGDYLKDRVSDGTRESVQSTGASSVPEMWASRS